MHNELTRVDIEKMKQEIAQREARIPELRAEIKRTREFGDLSENDEYKCAKKEYGANNGRIRYLKNMIETAIIIEVGNTPKDVVGVFDTVEVYNEEDDETETYRIVTTLRNDVFSGNVSKESPFGRAVLGKRVGDRVTIEVNEKYSYPVVIKCITKGEDDASLPITKY